MAGKATYQVMVETRRLLAGQGKVVRDIEEDLAALDSLAARAAMLASGAHGGAEAQKMMEELRGKISKLRHWITSGDVGAHASLLEVSEGQARLEQSLRRAVAREIALKEAEVGQGQTLLQHRANASVAGTLQA